MNKCYSTVALLLLSLTAAPARAQQPRQFDLSLGWAPIFGDNVSFRVLPAWALSFSGRDFGPVSPAVDVSGWYFGNAQSIHNVIAGPRFQPRGDGVRPFGQVLAGVSVWYAYNAAVGFAVVPGGGVDVPVADGRFSVRLEADYFGMYSPGDYGRHYWGHVWRTSAGVVLVQKR
ncbi:MAG TPA: hypothetical protein VGJ29_14320 [Vicinamibacterales bacterium]